MFLTGTLQSVLKELTICYEGFSRWEDLFLSCRRQNASYWNGKAKLLWAVLSDLSPVHSSRAKCMLFSCLLLLYLLGLASPQLLPWSIARYSLSFFLTHHNILIFHHFLQLGKIIALRLILPLLFCFIILFLPFILLTVSGFYHLQYQWWNFLFYNFFSSCLTTCMANIASDRLSSLQKFFLSINCIVRLKSWNRTLWQTGLSWLEMVNQLPMVFNEQTCQSSSLAVPHSLKGNTLWFATKFKEKGLFNFFLNENSSFRHSVSNTWASLHFFEQFRNVVT